jgi:hypothetical protein
MQADGDPGPQVFAVLRAISKGRVPETARVVKAVAGKGCKLAHAQGN